MVFTPARRRISASSNFEWSAALLRSFPPNPLTAGPPQLITRSVGLICAGTCEYRDLKNRPSSNLRTRLPSSALASSLAPDELCGLKTNMDMISIPLLVCDVDDVERHSHTPLLQILSGFLQNVHQLHAGKFGMDLEEVVHFKEQALQEIQAF